MSGVTKTYKHTSDRTDLWCFTINDAMIQWWDRTDLWCFTINDAMIQWWGHGEYWSIQTTATGGYKPPPASRTTTVCVMTLQQQKVASILTVSWWSLPLERRMSSVSDCDSTCERLGQSLWDVAGEGVRRHGCRTGIGSRILPLPSLFHDWGYTILLANTASHQWGWFSATSTCCRRDPPMFVDRCRWTAYWSSSCLCSTGLDDLEAWNLELYHSAPKSQLGW